MSNVTLWARPGWDIDRWVRDFFGPASANDLLAGDFTPAAEVVKDGDDAVVRLELAGVDVDKDVNVELDRGRLVIHGERRDERASEDPAEGRPHPARGPLRVVPPVVQAAGARHQRRDLGVV